MFDGLQSILLERAWLLCVLLAAVQFVLICLWSWRRTIATKHAVWIGFVIMPFLIGLSVLVTTTREQIINLCRVMARYVEERNVSAITTHLSNDFAAVGLDRFEFEQRLIGALDRYRIDRPDLSRFDVTIDKDDGATAAFDAACFVRGDQVLANRVLTRWLVSFHRERDRWLVQSIELIPTPFSPIRDLRRWID